MPKGTVVSDSFLLETSNLQNFSKQSADANSDQTAITVSAEVVTTSVVMMSEAEARQHIENIKTRLDDITVLLLELDNRRGWEALHYRSMHQMIQAELKDYLKKSVSQIYRLINDAKIRRELSHVCEKVEEIPQRQLEPLGKLKPEQWQDAWKEVVSTAPNSGITRQHVQAVVKRCLRGYETVKSFQVLTAEQVSLNLGDWVEVQSNQGSKNWDGLRGQIVELEDNDQRFGVDLSEASGQAEWNCLRFTAQELIKVITPHKVGDIVSVDIDRREAASPQEKKWNGFWGIVMQIGEMGLTINVGPESLQLFPRDLKPIDLPSNELQDVVSRVLKLRGLELDEIEERMLDVVQRREWFTSKQLIHLKNIEKLYPLADSAKTKEQRPKQCRSP